MCQKFLFVTLTMSSQDFKVLDDYFAKKDDNNTSDYQSMSNKTQKWPTKMNNTQHPYNFFISTLLCTLWNM